MTDWLAPLLIGALTQSPRPAAAAEPKETSMSDQPPTQTPTQQLAAALTAASTAVAKLMQTLQLSLGALREEGFTALMVGTVQDQDPDVLVPSFPNEPKTGADLIWIDKASGGKKLFLIQAKRLNPLTLQYDELDHTVGSTGKLQVDLLLETTAGIDEEAQDEGGFAKAYYFFYNFNPLSSADNGIFWLPADVVKTLVSQGKTSLAALKKSSFYQPLSAFANEVGLG
ncbi:hypothetical protein SAMN06265365_12216 [Tistlia consotensis]|uniref:Uncharacterized protein n=2 Tax=Tistlia TaxID=1321364 RepID=A0A1Y6CFM0_9PROT|nr:hypothetical protein SAMN05428998_12416 [Tistlia consotensis USBA 355]SNR94733.1 hypothetical protein SAMN06265365_12216 [Tistlia consotensis]